MLGKGKIGVIILYIFIFGLVFQDRMGGVSIGASGLPLHGPESTSPSLQTLPAQRASPGLQSWLLL